MCMWGHHVGVWWCVDTRAEPSRAEPSLSGSSLAHSCWDGNVEPEFQCVCFTCWGVWWCTWRPGSWRRETSSRFLSTPEDAPCNPRFLMTHTHTHTHKTKRCFTFYTHSLLGTDIIRCGKQKVVMLPRASPTLCTRARTHTHARVLIVFITATKN